MRRIALWLLATITIGVLLFGYHTSAEGPLDAAAETVQTAAAVPGETTIPGTVEPSTPATTSTAPAPSTSAAGSGTILGSTAQTRWGPVQVQIVVSDGRITDVKVPVYPTGNNKDRQINARAVPILIDETLTAQSAHIDMVSGATVTSEGYVRSLQAAIDEAGL